MIPKKPVRGLDPRMDTGFRERSCSTKMLIRLALAAIRARRRRRRTRPRVEIAEAAVAGDHVRHAFFDCTIFAIPDHVAAEILHRAPRRVAERVAGWNVATHGRHEGGSRYHRAHGSPHELCLVGWTSKTSVQSLFHSAARRSAMI